MPTGGGRVDVESESAALAENFSGEYHSTQQIASSTFVVTRNGEPVAELRPLRAGRRTFISRDEVAALASANVRVDRDRFRADLDKVIDQEL